MTVFQSTRGVRVGISAASAAVVAVSLVVAPPERRAVPITTHQVQLAAVLVGAMENSTAPDAVTTPAVPVPDVVASPTAAATAAEAEGGTSWDSLDSPLAPVVFAANLLLLPLWFLATPITLPLSILVAAYTTTPYETPGGNFGQIQFLAGAAANFLGGPLVLLSSLSNSASSAAAEAPTARRAGAAAEPGPLSVPVSLDAADAADAADESDPATGALDALRAATDTPRGGRLAERRTGTTPRASAAVTATTPRASAAVTSTTPRASAAVTSTIPKASAAVSTGSSSETAGAEASSPKSRVTSRSRR